MDAVETPGIEVMAVSGFDKFRDEVRHAAARRLAMTLLAAGQQARVVEVNRGKLGIAGGGASRGRPPRKAAALANRLLAAS